MNSTNTAWKVGFIGECMIEMQGLAGDIRMTFGGDTLNTAVYMARLGQDRGVQVEYITALGDDSFSTAMLDFWQAENVASTLVQRLPGKLPGLYFIELDSAGERRFSYWRGESAARECFELPHGEGVLAALQNFDALYVSGISLAILRPQGRRLLLDRLRQLVDKGLRVFFDCNYRARLWGKDAQAACIAARPWYQEMLGLSAVVLLTQEEAHVPLLQPPARAADLCFALAALGAAEVVIKNGDQPCYALAGQDLFAAAPIRGVQVVDTTAAGDSFSAAYLLARHVGMHPEQALSKAHALAGAVITHKGAVMPRQSMPDLFS